MIIDSVEQICFGQVYDESIEYRISNQNQGIDKYRRNQVSNQYALVLGAKTQGGFWSKNFKKI